MPKPVKAFLQCSFFWIKLLIKVRFIATPILTERAVSTLTKKFQELDLDWALAEDSAKAVLKVATDTTINGCLAMSAMKSSPLM